MSVTSLDLMPVVNKAHQTAACEAEWRGVCARAYYAIFDDIKTFHCSLPSPGNAPGHLTGMHEVLHGQLQNPGVKSEDPRHVLSRKIGIIAKNMHLNRIKADYKRDETMTLQDANTSVQQANTILGLLAGGQPPLPPPKHVVSSKGSQSPDTKMLDGVPRIGGKPSLKVVK
ncbi:hypothetical protein [Ralstonia sp. UBA689]|uniref:hypothetical protein n=1 Tax=Ralstonia sp. UBA689 TaxID=1947373 RepID=UPI0025E23343|nr:hypothetical protein [Ralstonia sp. UBA689]